ncbi:MAG: DoxX family protein [Rhodocyclaceae bacterium]|nr:DoxX family protein [Rhodocyclaceae bacterium]
MVSVLKPLAVRVLAMLDGVGEWIGLLLLRALVGWEFLEAGWTKLHRDNWFADIQDQFPFPFSVVPPEISWQMATWFELLGGIALIIGLATRFFSVSLIILTVVAILSAHWPAEWNSLAELAQGYVLTDDGYGNFKLPLILLVMLTPLVFCGPGRLSIDGWIRQHYLVNR